MKLARGTLRPCREKGGVAVAEMPAPVPSTTAAVLDPPVTRDYVAVARQYAADVSSGRIVAGTWVKKAARRFVKMLRRAGKAGSLYVFSSSHATDVCAFAEQCPHVEGTWDTPTIVLQPWQVFILVACYGFRRKVDGRRLTTVVFFQVSRKSAKSTLVAIAALFHLVREKEPGAQVICGATTGSQARIVFGIMQKMVRKSPYLRNCGLTVYANSITFDDTGGFAKPINAKSSTQDGLNPSFISLDESHAQTFELHDVLKSAMGARPDGMMWMPTTAGYDLTSVGHTERRTAMKLLDTAIEADHVFCILYELDEGDSWDNPRTWVKSAPMLGISPKLEWVKQYCLEAKHTPEKQAEFETKICNRWLQSAHSWLPMQAWDRCADPKMRAEQFLGEPCWIGADLAQIDDLAAKALLFRRDGLICAFVRFYLPRGVVEERERAVPAYRQWANSGQLTLTEGTMIDYDVIEADIRHDCERFDVRAIRMDTFGSAQMAGRLFNDGLPAAVLPKNAKTFTPAARELETRIRHGRFRHDGNEALKWNASNAVVRRGVDDSVLPKKESAESPNKIDGLDAILEALAVMVTEVEEVGSSYSDGHGLLIV